MKRKSILDFNGLNWMLDSGAFSEISINGEYTYTVDEYLKIVEKYNPRLFFNLDYMCEPHILEKTGATVKKHQLKSIYNQIEIQDHLNEYDIKSEFAGVIQGWTAEQYLEHIDMLKGYGCLRSKMGIGSICRRNAVEDITKIIMTIKKELPNTRLHAFGLHSDVLQNSEMWRILESSDSSAWSMAGRKINYDICGDCINLSNKNCANCYRYMLIWYNKVICFDIAAQN